MKIVNKYISSSIIAIIILGVLFLNVKLFYNHETLSKSFWLYISIFLCGILAPFIVESNKIPITPTTCLAATLFVYCLFNTHENEFTADVLCVGLILFLIYYFSYQLSDYLASIIIPFIIVICLGLLSLYGIGQYIFNSNDIGNHHIGGFDNPAGYASALSFGFPFVLYCLTYNRKFVKYISIIVSVLIITGIIISGSRAGIITIVVIGFIYIIGRKILHKRRLIKNILIVCIPLCLISLYFVKKDSADGRLLIWSRTIDMVQDKPFLGYGYNGFKANYMTCQAKYFEQNQDSSMALLADNVNHPFNEYLLFISEFGLVGFALLLAIIILFLYRYIRYCDYFELIHLLSLIAIIIFSLFSYPFRYPFTWLLLAYNVGVLASYRKRLELFALNMRFAIPVVSFILLLFTSKEIYSNYRWFSINHTSSVSLSSEYDLLYNRMRNRPYFLYSYAYQLYSNNFHARSISVIDECEVYLNDYDIQMLKAHNYKNINNHHKAIESYLLASNMCPNRFMPLYELVNMYDSINSTDQALKLARAIIDKPVKIPSGTVSAIKSKMRQRVAIIEVYKDY